MRTRERERENLKIARLNGTEQVADIYMYDTYVYISG
jgi:hypothetical protein